MEAIALIEYFLYLEYKIISKVSIIPLWR